MQSLPNDIQFDDIQAVILRGYPTLKFARFLLVRMSAVEQGLTWLNGIVPQVRPFSSDASASSSEQKSDTAVHIAFSREGLAFIGLEEQEMASFSRPFREGMTAEHRSRALGDNGPNSPDLWRWGGTSSQEPHLLILCYASSEQRLSLLLKALALCSNEALADGLQSVFELPTQALPNGKEHFGFKDGISQPKISELSASANAHTHQANQPHDEVRIGEFVLGYPDEYGELPHSPALSKKVSLKRNISEGSEQYNHYDWDDFFTSS